MTDADFAAIKALLDTPQPAALGPARRTGTLSESQLADALKPMLARAKVPARNAELIRALLLLWHDHLDASHTISQGIDDADGSFVHALMHRREPDAWNSKYWWRRVGAHPAFSEIGRRVGEFLKQEGDTALASKLLPRGAWDANAFVDACDGARDLPDSEPLSKSLREIQRIETEVLLEYLAESK